MQRLRCRSTGASIMRTVSPAWVVGWLAESQRAGLECMQISQSQSVDITACNPQERVSANWLQQSVAARVVPQICCLQLWLGIAFTCLEWTHSGRLEKDTLMRLLMRLHQGCMQLIAQLIRRHAALAAALELWGDWVICRSARLSSQTSVFCCSLRCLQVSALRTSMHGKSSRIFPSVITSHQL